MDNFNREAIAIVIGLSLPSQRVTIVLERIVAWGGYPKQLRMDNGPEFISATLAEWAEEHNIKLELIKKSERRPKTYTSNDLNGLTEIKF